MNFLAVLTTGGKIDQPKWQRMFLLFRVFSESCKLLLLQRRDMSQQPSALWSNLHTQWIDYKIVAVEHNCEASLNHSSKVDRTLAMTQSYHAIIGQSHHANSRVVFQQAALSLMASRGLAFFGRFKCRESTLNSSSIMAAFMARARPSWGQIQRFIVLPEAPISHPYNPGLATASQLPPPKKNTNLEIIKLANSESPQGAWHSAFTWFISVLETRNKTNATSLHHIHWVTWHGVPSFVGLDGGHFGLRKWEINLWRLRSSIWIQFT